MITESILTCPNCKYKESEEMHENVFPTKFNCGSCQQTVSIKDGECCIYCQFGDFSLFTYSNSRVGLLC